MTVTVSKGKGIHTFTFLLSEDLANYFINNELVTIETESTFRFREATLADIKTSKLSKTNNFTYTSIHANLNLIGKWSIEKQGDWFIFDHKI